MPVPRAIAKAINIADLKRLARRRLPRILFDWVEGGAEDERGLARNEAQFGRYRLLPRYLEDVGRIDLAPPCSAAATRRLSASPPPALPACCAPAPI